MKKFRISYIIQTASTYGKYNYDAKREIEAESKEEAILKLKSDIASSTSRKRYKVLVRTIAEI